MVLRLAADAPGTRWHLGTDCVECRGDKANFVRLHAVTENLVPA
jgi:hypothetical protein